MAVDLCIVSYNTNKEVNRLLKTLQAGNTYRTWSLFVADNGSTDGSRDSLFKNQRLYGIDSLCLNQNIGYAAACNQLASIGNSEIIGLLNADVWLKDGDVQEIDKRFREHPEIHILGPKQMNERGQIVHGGIFGTPRKPRHRGWKKPDQHDQLYKDLEPALTVSGSAYFIRRSTWERLTQCDTYQKMFPAITGAFLPTPHYYEETWCSYHARAHDYGVFYDGSITVGHSWHASSDIGGEADQKFNYSRAIFRKACDIHGIDHE